MAEDDETAQGRNKPFNLFGPRFPDGALPPSRSGMRGHVTVLPGVHVMHVGGKVAYYPGDVPQGPGHKQFPDFGIEAAERKHAAAINKFLRPYRLHASNSKAAADLKAQIQQYAKAIGWPQRGKAKLVEIHFVTELRVCKRSTVMAALSDLRKQASKRI